MSSAAMKRPRSSSVPLHGTLSWCSIVSWAILARGVEARNKLFGEEWIRADGAVTAVALLKMGVLQCE